MDKMPVETNAKSPAASRILAVTEEELQRIILDMHDGPVQQLFAAQSQLSSLQARAQKGENVPRSDYTLAVNRVSALVSEALNEIRLFLGTFRPPDFARRSIDEILRGLFMHHELTTGYEVEFIEEATAVTLPLPVKIALYRICQEALSNAYRHAHANRQQVRLWQTADWLCLEVRDDGVGFQPPPLHGPQATEREEHIGLRGMRDRIALVNGRFELNSAPGQGTRIFVKVPLHE